MDRDEIVQRVRAHRAQLGEFGVVSLALFGSVASGETRDDSDVDVLVQFDGPATFDVYIDLKLFLEDLLERPVELVTHRALRDKIRPQVEQDLLLVA